MASSKDEEKEKPKRRIVRKAKSDPLAALRAARSKVKARKHKRVGLELKQEKKDKKSKAIIDHDEQPGTKLRLQGAGSALKRVRVKAKLAPGEVSKETGFDPSYILRFEENEATVPFSYILGLADQANLAIEFVILSCYQAMYPSAFKRNGKFAHLKGLIGNGAGSKEQRESARRNLWTFIFEDELRVAESKAELEPIYVRWDDEEESWVVLLDGQICSKHPTKFRACIKGRRLSEKKHRQFEPLTKAQSREFAMD